MCVIPSNTLCVSCDRLSVMGMQAKHTCPVCMVSFAHPSSLSRHRSHGRCHGDSSAIQNSKMLSPTYVDLGVFDEEPTGDMVQQMTTMRKMMLEMMRQLTALRLELEHKNANKETSTSNNSNTGVSTNFGSVDQSTTTHNNITNTNNNTLVVNAFGSELKSYVTDAFLTACLKQKGQGIVELAKAVHFNSNHPENHNVMAKSESAVLKHKNIMYMDRHSHWCTGDRDGILKTMFDNNYDTLDYHMGSNEDRLREEIGHTVYRQIEQWFDERRNSSPATDLEKRACIAQLTRMVIDQSKLLHLKKTV